MVEASVFTEAVRFQGCAGVLPGAVPGALPGALIVCAPAPGLFARGCTERVVGSNEPGAGRVAPPGCSPAGAPVGAGVPRGSTDSLEGSTGSCDGEGSTEPGSADSRRGRSASIPGRTPSRAGGSGSVPITART